jgi:putative glutamine amidotransferase
VYPHNPRHALDTTPGSVLDGICGPRTVLVNSSHRCAVECVADGLRVSAVTQDGVVEALEWADDDWFAMGVQFQPETDGGVDLAASLFETFLDEVISRGVTASDQSPAGIH